MSIFATRYHAISSPLEVGQSKTEMLFVKSFLQLYSPEKGKYFFSWQTSHKSYLKILSYLCIIGAPIENHPSSKDTVLLFDPLESTKRKIKFASLYTCTRSNGTVMIQA